MSASQVSISSEEAPDTLVENRRAFGGEDMAFSIYDTTPFKVSRVVSSSSKQLCG